MNPAFRPTVLIKIADIANRPTARTEQESALNDFVASFDDFSPSERRSASDFVEGFRSAQTENEMLDNQMAFLHAELEHDEYALENQDLIMPTAVDIPIDDDVVLARFNEQLAELDRLEMIFLDAYERLLPHMQDQLDSLFEMLDSTPADAGIPEL